MLYLDDNVISPTRLTRNLRFSDTHLPLVQVQS